MNNPSWFFYPNIYEEKQALRALRKGSVLPSKHRVRSYHVYCNAQLIQSQNENFLLAKILDFQIPTTLSQAGCLCKRPGGVKKKKKKNLLLQWMALRLAAGAEDTPVFPTVQLPSPPIVGC